jgi:hypothetical protein
LGDLIVVDAPEGAATARYAAGAFNLQQNDLAEISTSQAPVGPVGSVSRPAQGEPRDPTGGVRF